MGKGNILYTLDKKELIALAKKCNLSLKQQKMVIDFFYLNIRPISDLENKYNLKSTTLRSYKYAFKKKLIKHV